MHVRVVHSKPIMGFNLPVKRLEYSRRSKSAALLLMPWGLLDTCSTDIWPYIGLYLHDSLFLLSAKMDMKYNHSWLMCLPVCPVHIHVHPLVTFVSSVSHPSCFCKPWMALLNLNLSSLKQPTICFTEFDQCKGVHNETQYMNEWQKRYDTFFKIDVYCWSNCCSINFYIHACFSNISNAIHVRVNYQDCACQLSGLCKDVYHCIFHTFKLQVLHV